MSVHTRIRQFREAKQLTHQQFADAVGVSRGAIQQWESGATAPARRTQPAVATFMGITVSELMTEEDPKHPTLPAIYQPNAPIPLAGRAGGAMDLEAIITGLRAHIRASGANADAVAALLSAVARNPDDERPAQALHIMLDTAFAQPEKINAQA